MIVIKPFVTNIFWFGFLSLITGCANNRGNYEIENDITKYVNEGLLEIEELERKPLEVYSGVIGTHYKSKQEVYDTLKNKVIGDYERFYNALREIHPSEEVVKKLHGKYIQGAEKILNGFKIKMLGIEINNEKMILEANEMIEHGSAEIAQWREALNSLCVKHGVAPEKKQEE